MINEVVADEGSAAPPELLVVNKIDAIDETRRTELRGMLGGAMFVSAQTGEGSSSCSTESAPRSRAATLR